MCKQELYRIRKFRIHKNDELFGWCERITSCANNLSNAVRFRQRQIMTGLAKSPSFRTANENEIITEVENFVSSQTKFTMPTEKEWNMSYEFLNSMLFANENPDYCAEGLPRQSAQHVIKQCCRDMKAFFKANKSYKKNPSAFTGKPELPGYKKKGGHCCCKLTNQSTVLHEKNGEWSVKLPLTDIHLNGGAVIDGYVLKEAAVIPDNGEYIISITLQKETDVPELSEMPERVMSVDLGVDNLISATNNAGAPFVIYKGEFLKSINQLYNKRIAEIMSKQTTGTNRKFVPNPESQAITIKRNNSISDGMHKVAKHFVHLCVEHRIDTVVIGVNKDFKQEANLGDVNNQNFVQIPFLMLRNMIQYLCEEKGIRYVEREESYTSKANFLNRDYIPTYGKDDKDASFTGKRRPTKYKSDYVKKDGFRGLYKTDDNIIINSDLNGSANIMRKEFPELADAIKDEDFNNVIVIKHPDYDLGKANQLKQKTLYKPSKAKMRRDKKKVS